MHGDISRRSRTRSSARTTPKTPTLTVGARGGATPPDDDAADAPFPKPTEPAGWREVLFGIWWLVVALVVALIATGFWERTWPPPTGLGALRIHLGFVIPMVIAWFGGVIAIVVGLFGVATRRSRSAAATLAPRPPSRRVVAA
ncbi:MAG: hypothetical protein NZ518_03010 [Dehalococcoidia bacterium]|nr:hypothetical protein [Dehalococcoidia bacterium]